MNTQSILEIADRIVSEKTGKHLTDLQFDLLQAACENKTYEEFALSRGYCLDYIKKDVGSELWHVLSKSLGEKVTKKNFRHAFERCQQIPVTNSKDELQSVNVVHGVDIPHLSTFLSNQHDQYPIILINCGEQRQNFSIGNLLEQIQANFSSQGRSYFIPEHLVSMKQIPESYECSDKYIYPFPNPEEAKQQISHLLYQYLTSCSCLIILDNMDKLFTVMEVWKENQSSSDRIG